MSVLIKAVRSPFKKAEHRKLEDNWVTHQEPVKDGLAFFAKYLGSTLLEELDEGESYGNKLSTKAVSTIQAMQRIGNKKLPQVTIEVSHRRVKVSFTDSGMVLTDLDIQRIHFCGADSKHSKVFTYIARSTENETMECHAFLCPKQKIADAITLTVAQAFNLAKEELEYLTVQRQEDANSIGSEDSVER